MRLVTDELNNSFSADNTHDNLNQNFLLKTKLFRFENPKKVIVGHRNINSRRNKLELLKPFIYNAFDIFLVSETKIASSFPNSQSRLAGFRVFRHDGDSFGRSLCISMKASL